MARTLKPQKIGVYENSNAGIVVDLMLDRNTKQFFAEVLGERIETKTFDELKPLLVKHCENLKPAIWKPVIHVVSETPPTYRFGYSTYGTTLSVIRFWWSTNPGGNYIQTSWDTPENNRNQKNFPFNWRSERYGSFSPPVSPKGSYDGEKGHYLPYSEKMWDTLNRVGKMLTDMHNSIIFALQSNTIESNLDAITYTELIGGSDA